MSIIDRRDLRNASKKDVMRLAKFLKIEIEGKSERKVMTLILDACGGLQIRDMYDRSR